MKKLLLILILFMSVTAWGEDTKPKSWDEDIKSEPWRVSNWEITCNNDKSPTKAAKIKKVLELPKYHYEVLSIMRYGRDHFGRLLRRIYLHAAKIGANTVYISDKNPKLLIAYALYVDYDAPISKPCKNQ